MSLHHHWVRTEEIHQVEQLEFDQPKPRWTALWSTVAVTIRSLLLAAAVFTAAAVTGGLLAGAAPATPAEPTSTRASNPSAPAPPDPAAVTTAAIASADAERAFARSMVYTGAVALMVAVAGMVMVARRRRAW